MEGSLMDYEMLITFDADPGEDLEALAESVLDGATEVHPEIGPVVGMNTADRTFDLLVSLPATSIENAVDRARPLVAAALVRAGLGGRVASRLEVKALPACSMFALPA
jgi:hypothetical protein